MIELIFNSVAYILSVVLAFVCIGISLHHYVVWKKRNKPKN